jgi:prepilin-type N-terminal cleavage/methylation domain-containing protein
MLHTKRGFTILEVSVGVAIFLLFALGVYSSLSFVFKIVYQSRLTILETALANEYLEIARNVPFEQVGTVGGIPSGVLITNQSIVRNGITFSVTTTVRNIDDSFDGTLGGSPNDTAPADYKLIEVAAQCLTCGQQKPVALSARVAPKNLEGASSNGALFINVFNALGLPVSGATVQVTNNSVSPAISINDVTDSQGYLRIIDTPTGTMTYNITVLKNGYSSDYTVPVSLSVPNPVRLPANVVSQSITSISFAIDTLGALNLRALSPACSELGATSFLLRGAKSIGINPTIYKYNQTINTNAQGEYVANELEWDTYTPSTSGAAYDIAGTIPMAPWSLSPGMTQDGTVILTPHTSHSFLVKVKDAGTQLPLSDATVRLTKTGYEATRVTGLGYTRQTDWSGGDGQAIGIDDTAYFSDDGNVDNDSPAGDISLRRTGQYYASNGWLESSTFDISEAVNFTNIIIDPTSQSSGVGANAVLVQVATSNSSSPATWSFTGPDGTISSYYTPSSTVLYEGLSGKRYLRYRLYLATADQSVTPVVSEIAFTYTTECAPPGQSFFGSLSAGTYTLEVTRDGYTTASGDVDVSGAGSTDVMMSVP